MLDWLYTAISWVLLRWHDLFSQFLGPGAAWPLAIIFLVVTLRLVLFPLFVKQIHSMAAMQKLQPQVAEIKKKYKDDRQAQARAMMELQKEAGVNPLGGCLPLVAQTPVFISLYHVLRHLKPQNNATLYGWSSAQFHSAVNARFFGAPLWESFRTADSSSRIVILIVLLISCAATYTTQRQSYNRNKATLDPQQAGIQKFLLYVLPIGLLLTGLVWTFPLGVLLYWVTNNIWTLGQQFYIFEQMKRKEAAQAAPPVDTKALAPKPGARPSAPKKAAPRASQPTTPAVAEAGEGGRTPTRAPGPAAGRRPRPGQRPNRPQRRKKRR